ncbi:DUF2255 family protein [Nocardiopsis sp. MG754419]|uniref:DUF2255 family protein n=1 Tax=Nocardiopsis sp. MG754419 TaxID=2259865 RepID=UPI0035B2E443
MGDRIYIRSYNGTRGKWYGPALETGRGRISAGGVEKAVRFVAVDPADEETNGPWTPRSWTSTPTASTR